MSIFADSLNPINLYSLTLEVLDFLLFCDSVRRRELTTKRLFTLAGFLLHSDGPPTSALALLFAASCNNSSTASRSSIVSSDPSPTFTSCLLLPQFWWLAVVGGVARLWSLFSRMSCRLSAAAPADRNGNRFRRYLVSNRNRLATVSGSLSWLFIVPAFHTFLCINGA